MRVERVEETVAVAQHTAAPSPHRTLSTRATYRERRRAGAGSAQPDTRPVVGAEAAGPQSTVGAAPAFSRDPQVPDTLPTQDQKELIPFGVPIPVGPS